LADFGGPHHGTYIQHVFCCILTGICWLSGCNGISQTYTELEWHFSKVESYSGVSQIHGNCSGVCPINPKIYAYRQWCIHQMCIILISNTLYYGLNKKDKKWQVFFGTLFTHLDQNLCLFYIVEYNVFRIETRKTWSIHYCLCVCICFRIFWNFKNIFSKNSK
jgi:hypothetical protein